MRTMRLVAGLLLTVVLGASAVAQVEVRTLVGAPGQGLGASLSALGDVNGDGVCDVAVGNAAGDVVRVFAGGPASNPLLWSYSGSFRTLATAGDLDLDGAADLIVGRPDLSVPGNCGRGEVLALSGASGGLLWSLDNSDLNGGMFWTNTDAYEIGASLAAGADFTQDGIPDVLVGAPGVDSCSGGWHEGLVLKLDGATGQYLGHSYFPSITAGPCHHDYGRSIALADDRNGDGVPDFFVGAPMPACEVLSGFGSGYHYVVSGATMANISGAYGPSGTFRYGAKLLWIPGRGAAVLSRANGQDQLRELGTFGFPSALVPQASVGAFHSLLALGNLDLDGGSEYAVGAGLGLVSGPVTIRKQGAAASVLQLTPPNVGTGWGAALAWGDFNGDGLDDLIVGEPGSNAGGPGAGAVHVFTIVRTATTYCESETNSAGCAPVVAATGVASASASQPFAISASGVLNQKLGLLFYGFTPQQVPFQGGHSCIRPPTTRTPVQFSAGSTSGADCSGSYSFDFNVRIASGVDPRLASGTLAFAQYWSRDPSDASHTNLSNALAFLIGP